MIEYYIELFDPITDDLIDKLEIPKSKLGSVAEIMAWNTIDKTSFFRGIGGFDVSKEQALAMEESLQIKFYSDDVVVQIAGCGHL